MPAVGCRSATARRRRVVLPAPLGPEIATRSGPTMRASKPSSTTSDGYGVTDHEWAVWDGTDGKQYLDLNGTLSLAEAVAPAPAIRGARAEGPPSRIRNSAGAAASVGPVT